MTPYPCSILTPSGKVFAEKIESLIAPGQEGSFGVLARHAPMVTLLGKGVVQIKDSVGLKYFAIESGILEVGQNSEVLILADAATPTEVSKLN